MTTLILKIARAPQMPSLAGVANSVAKRFDRFVQAWAESQAMARSAQQRYPFSIE
jgi:hypothetical protein